MINNLDSLKTSKAILLGIVVCAFIINTIACRPSESEEEQDHTGHAHAADDNHSHAATNEQPPAAPTPKAPTPTDDAHDHAPSTDTVLVSLPVDDHQLERLDLAVQPVLAGGLDAWLRVPGERQTCNCGDPSTGQHHQHSARHVSLHRVFGIQCASSLNSPNSVRASEYFELIKLEWCIAS